MRDMIHQRKHWNIFYRVQYDADEYRFKMVNFTGWWRKPEELHWAANNFCREARISLDYIDCIYWLVDVNSTTIFKGEVSGSIF